MTKWSELIFNRNEHTEKQSTSAEYHYFREHLPL